MTKLTVAARDIIRDRLLDHRFKKPIEDAQEDLFAIGLKIYDAAFAPSEKKLLAAMPDGWLHTQGWCYVCDSQGGRYTEIRFGKDMPLPHKFRQSLPMAAPDALMEECTAAEDALTALKAERAVALQEIRALLHTFNTIKQLREGWPEVAPFLEGLDAPPAPKNALVPVDLNTKLGLPVEESV